MYHLPSYLASAVFAIAALTSASTALANDDDHHGVRQELQALKAQVAALMSQNAALQKQVNGLQTQLTNARNVLALAPFVSVDPNPQWGVAGPNITFSGANLHIVSGSGSTDDGGHRRGLGNLIIGYDEVAFKRPVLAGERGGSHNLVIGSGHWFTQGAYGGLVVGDANTISAWGASVSGGFYNTASAYGASVSGGGGNTASGTAASVSGGQANLARAIYDSILGGVENIANGGSVVVLGGSGVTANNHTLIAPHPPFP